MKLRKTLEPETFSQSTANRKGNRYQAANDTSEDAKWNSKSNVQLSRVSSAESLKQLESKSWKRNKKLEFTNTNAHPISNGGSNRAAHAISKTLNPVFGTSRKFFSASVPGSRMGSRATSPTSRHHSPPRSTTPTPTLTRLVTPDIISDIRVTDDNINQEVLQLRIQVENLTRKTLLQAVDLERTTKQLKEAVAIAGEETAKCKAAKEVIKSLTAQLKDMAERLPIGASKSNKLILANLSTNFALSDTSFPEVVQQCSPVPTNNTDLNGSNGLLLSDGQNSINLNQPVPTRAVRNGGKLNDTDANHEPTEWVEQDHPGVYITLTSLPGGVKDLKRVRFSRKRFSEKQAEKWWAENRVRVYQQYNVRMVDKSVVGIPNNVAPI